MPALLHYEIVTDPTSIQASSDGAPSVGTVYVIASNTHQAVVEWEYIDLEIPVGTGPEHLTNDPAAITASLSKTDSRPWRDVPTLAWNAGLGLFRAESSSGFAVNLRAREAVILKLENVPVSRGEGLVALRIHERAGGGDSRRATLGTHYTTVLGLVKQRPRVPANFRADLALLDTDAGDALVLRWDGPDNLDYWIRDPEGNDVHHVAASGGPAVAQASHSWSTAAPKRGTTYTLVAGTPGIGQPEAGYFLTTTVHALVPEFGSGTRSPWIEGTTTPGRVTFTTAGAEVQEQGGAPGTLTADTADVNTVRTLLARGRNDADGWIEFADGGVNVFHGTGRDPGALTAGAADLTSVRTGLVRGRNDADGWIEFADGGVNVFHGTGRDWGVVRADKADVNGIHTKWVQGADGSAGWIEFPANGINVFQGAGSRQWGTVAADRADLNDLVTARAQVKERLTVQGGLTVGDVLETQDGPARLIVHGLLEVEEELRADRKVVVGGDLSANGDLTVHGDVRPLRNLEVGGAVTASDLTVRNKLTTQDGQFTLAVHGESVFHGKVNANQHLSVRNESSGWVLHTSDELVSIRTGLRVAGESVFHGKVNANQHLSVRSEDVGWILHTGDDKVAIQADLRVHGAFRSDS
ncbi:hypothetical protein ACFCX4_24500 [Kitasatospora sp. NPDC056327]|uniref:hypothetical protein n=1 Tax=Kitasatospora sp. NPDC056327 TaxID=3345785 RepID=UPI0035DB9002